MVTSILRGCHQRTHSQSPSKSHPRHLIHKKLYLAAGVVAAFECKLTLRPGHITQAFIKSLAIRALYDTGQGTPYKELHSPLIYGLLAHSCLRRASEPSYGSLFRYHDEVVKGAAKINHPRESLDLICIADLGTFPSVRLIESPHREDSSKSVRLWYKQLIRKEAWPDALEDRDFADYDPIGTALYDLLKRLAWRDVTLRPIAEYFRAVVNKDSGISEVRMWPREILSENVRLQLDALGEEERGEWDEWSLSFGL